MIIFLSCVKQKRKSPCCAQDMYISDLFKKSFAYAKTFNAEKIYILSAKYGVLELDEIISPYNLTLNQMPEQERKRWAYRVCKQLEAKGISYNQEVIFLCGKNYRKYLMQKFKNSTAPCDHMPIDKQLAWYKKIKKVRTPQ